MKLIKKIFKITIIFFAIITTFFVIAGATFYYKETNSLNLDESKFLTQTNNLEIFDKNKISIKPTHENYIDINDLKPHTKNAFISAEDKRFFSHNGLDFIRIGGAIISNLKTKSFSQGASTISQQLVKNTQLSNEKTISRKIKEIKLTKQLEKKYSKNDILNLYLNNIYFGNGCYGIENASNHYFSKSSKDLTLSESAILAGTINAPSIYDIESNPEKANERKNLILKLMNTYGKITDDEYKNAINEKVKLNISKLSNYNYIYNEIIQEACRKLNITENQLKNSKLKIYSYIDLNLQNEINKIINKNYNNIESNPSISTIVLDNETSGVLAIKGTKSSLKNRKQPGSTIKPILVYAPAIENGNVSPATKIIDEKINISGYSPENADKKYHGQVSVREALKNSYNIPAVKLLNEIGIKNAQNFANKLGIPFSPNDNNLAIALGGFTDGLTLFELANAYTTFANNGTYAPEKYISKIIKNNKIIYENDKQKKQVMKDSTAYLITDILKDTSKTGTAKRLKEFNFDIASKTGTVGDTNSSKNIETYNISYTTSHTIISYFGGSKMPEYINGATHPTMLTKDIISYLYKNNIPHNFIKPNSVQEKEISKKNYDKNIIVLANENEDSIKEIFTQDTKINENNKIDFKINVLNLENKKPIVSFSVSDRYSYYIIRKNKSSEEIISSELSSDNIIKNYDSISNIKINNLKIKNLNDRYIAKQSIIFEDKNAKSGEIYEYFAIFCDKNTKKEYKSNVIKLKVF
ncbi:MAG: penicillin-binding protein [Clostridia bacterium]|nr:penicillin-binding protein [Clostridia bacterium]